MAVIPNNLKKEMAEEYFTSGKVYKISLHTSSLIPDPDTHKYFSDMTNEITGINYTDGGDVIGSPVITQDDETNSVTLDFADYTFENITFTGARYACLYINATIPAISPIIAILDFGQNKYATAENFVIEFSPHGIITID